MIVRANAVEQTFSANIAVFSGNCGALTCIDYDGSYSSWDLFVEWLAYEGTTYYIVVTDLPTIASGSFTFSVIVSP
jgi:hypothetical protein